MFYFWQVFITVIILLISPLWSAERVAVQGKVTEFETDKPLSNVNVMLKGTVWGTITNNNGDFVLMSPAGTYDLVVRHIGYRIVSQKIEVREDMPSRYIVLKESPIELSALVVTATRTTTPVTDVPANVTVFSASDIEQRGGLSLDDMLVSEPGVDVYRSGGIYTLSPDVILRSTGGGEPSRTLVMIDGIPINKSDTGGSNWNRIKAETIEQVEIVRGPASALYGSSAMGGVINLITKMPEEGIHAKIQLQGGNLSTAGVDLSISGGRIMGENQFLGFLLFGNYFKSDGYVSEPESERTIYTVKRFLDENSQTAKLMYLNGSHEVTAIYQRYDDERGEGEKIMAPEGEFRDFDTDFLTLQYLGGTSRWQWEVKGFYQLERYGRIDERMRDEDYERFDVLSDRKELGYLSRISYRAGRLGLLSIGFDAKEGSVDGADTYKTSPDILANKGTLTTFSGFVQDEISLFNNQVNVVGGLRLDRVKFHHGEINSTIAPWDTYNGSLDSYTWEAVSPRVGLSAQVLNNTRLYASLGKAFRSASLDDLCRSGWIKGGPKIANPFLEPETMTNVELGLQQSVGRSLFKINGYYAMGKDFLYYVDTDQTVFGGRYTLRQRQNVARVRMKGVEVSIQMPVGRIFDLSAGLTVSRSVIFEFPERVDLEGKKMTYSPEQKGKIALGFHAFLSGSVIWELTGKQYTDDQNSDEISAYHVLHLNVSKEVITGLSLGIKIRNLFDTQYLQSNDSLDPGRIILGTLTYVI